MAPPGHWRVARNAMPRHSADKHPHRVRESTATMMSAATRCLPLLAVLAATPVLGQAIPCGEPYTVQRGDTLQRIAIRAYGPEASYRDLLEPNRSVFRNGNPSLIEIGQQLVIPCRPTAAAGDEPVVAGGEAPPEAPQTATLLRIETPLTASAWPVLEAAFTRADVPMPALAPSQAGEMPLPEALAGLSPGSLAATVVGADCTAAARSPHHAALCETLAWSAPLAEAVLSTFTRAETGPVTLDVALADRRICTVPAIPAHILEARGLGGDGTGITTAPDAAACFTQLRAGAVDAAILPAVEADATIADLPPGTPVIEQFGLSQLVTLHAVVRAGDDAGTALLAELDEALSAMQADGTWRAQAMGGPTLQ